MAETYKLEGTYKEAWDMWVASRPKVIQDMAAKLPPNKLYRLKSTEQRVTIYSYSENQTVTVNVLALYNPGLTLERRVFGIPADDLEECDLPLNVANN